MADEPKDPPGPLTRAAVLAYLGRADTLRMVLRYVERKLPADSAEEVAQDVLAEALEAEKFPATEEALPAWLHGIGNNLIADWLEKRRTHRKYEGEMPKAPEILDEAGLPVADPGDAVVDIDPSHDPNQVDFRAEGILFTRWMRQAVKDNPQDATVWRIMEEHADTGRSLQDLARENGMSAWQLSRRMRELKDKYSARYNRYRNSLVILLLLGALVLVGLLVWRFTRPAQPERVTPDPAAKPLVPPSAAPQPSTEPSDTQFNQAAPTDGGSDFKPGGGAPRP